MKENICERHFLDNMSQSSQGRYIIKLPVREQMLNNIGDSRESVLKRLRGIERRFKHDPIFKIQYAAFLDEYLSLGHMRRMEPPLRKKQYRFIFHTIASSKRLSKHRKFVLYLMHLAVAVPAYRYDALLMGPTVQQDLISILMRFRFFTYVITADITKMYRQILMHPSQTRLQRILWRNDLLLMSIRTNSLPSLTVQLPRHSWPPNALSIWPSSTLINSLAVQHASFEIFMSMTCSSEQIQSTN